MTRRRRRRRLGVKGKVHCVGVRSLRNVVFRDLSPSSTRARFLAFLNKKSCRWQTHATLAKWLHGLWSIDRIPLVHFVLIFVWYRIGVEKRRLGSLFVLLLVSHFITITYHSNWHKLLRLYLATFLKWRQRIQRPWNPAYSRSSKVTSFDSLRMVSYYRPI